MSEISSYSVRILFDSFGVGSPYEFSVFRCRVASIWRAFPCAPESDFVMLVMLVESIISSGTHWYGVRLFSLVERCDVGCIFRVPPNTFRELFKFVLPLAVCFIILNVEYRMPFTPGNSFYL